MKRVWVIVLLSLFWLPVNGFGQILPSQFSALSSISKNVKVNTYGQVGFQWVGSNLSLPIQAESVSPFLEIGTMDVSLKDGNFWAGMAGFSLIADDKYSLFGSAGCMPNRPFITSGTIPVQVQPGSLTANVEFTNTKVESWFVQTGIGLGPVLFGLYWDHFAFALGDPRNQDGPLNNQTLRGDILTKTFAPFVGFSLPTNGATITVTYSPFAYSNTALALINSRDNVSELRYTWNKPGNMLNAMVQYNKPISSSTSFGIWCNYSHMSMRQNAELEFRNAPTPTVSTTRDVRATMTKYVYGGGITFGFNF